MGATVHHDSLRLSRNSYDPEERYHLKNNYEQN